jgi:hypothetical protein
MRLIGDDLLRVLCVVIPFSAFLAYGSSLGLIVVIRWAKLGKPRGFLISWLQHHFRTKSHCARLGDLEFSYLTDEDS